MAGSWVYLGRDGVFVALMAISKPLWHFLPPKKSMTGRRVTYFGEQGEMLQGAARQADIILTAGFYHSD